LLLACPLSCKPNKYTTPLAIAKTLGRRADIV